MPKILKCPKCGRDMSMDSGLGRKPYPIPFTNVCKALRESRGNFSAAARHLEKQTGQRVTAGFVQLRVIRAGKTLQGILEGK